MNLNLNSKTALVSASTSGIGHAIAAQLLEDGARVIINGRNEKSVKQVVDTFNKQHDGNRALPLVADLGVAGSEKVAAAAYPEIDILVNNLGIYELSDFFSTSDDDWRRLFEVNVFSGVRLARTYMKAMLERKQGRVIFISSEVALTPLAAMAFGIILGFDNLPGAVSFDQSGNRPQRQKASVCARTVNGHWRRRGHRNWSGCGRGHGHGIA
jgi:3-oxoacyl-[acyl-carrier protein] reductase